MANPIAKLQLFKPTRYQPVNGSHYLKWPENNGCVSVWLLERKLAYARKNKLDTIIVKGVELYSIQARCGAIWNCANGWLPCEPEILDIADQLPEEMRNAE